AGPSAVPAGPGEARRGCLGTERVGGHQVAADARPAESGRASLAGLRAGTGSAQPAKAAGGAGETALIGRDAELERIATALSRAVEERRGRLVLVCGEPAIGKSPPLQAAA